jgi:glycosyltransferase involved in cell wall biosynthesis
MNTRPLISIITVVYNGKKHLEQTIQSVLNQTYTNFEYIIIDGGSTDGTVDIIKKYENQINYWISEPDNGIYDAMNKGLAQAKGDYIGLLNSDDFYESNALEIITNEIKTTPNTDVFFGNMFILNQNLQEKQLQTYKKGENLHKIFSIWHPTVFVKKECYKKYGNFDTNFKIAADYELLLRLKKQGCSFKYINKPITNFREGGTSYYHKKLKYERFRLQKMHTSCVNAYWNLFWSIKIEILQKIFMKILGEKRYHQIRYKYLYK